MAPKERRRPTRRDLLVVVGELQNLIGLALAYNNDRNPDKQANVDDALGQALTFCIEARGQDPPIDKNLGPWRAPIQEREKTR